LGVIIKKRFKKRPHFWGIAQDVCQDGW